NVVLRGLSINGQGGNYGIRITSANRVHLEDLIVSNMTLAGISILPSGFVTVSISNSVVRDNGADGIQAFGATQLTISGVRSERNPLSGITVNDGAQALISRSKASENTFSGIVASYAAGSTRTIVNEDSVASQNGASGVAALATAAGLGAEAYV